MSRMAILLLAGMVCTCCQGSKGDLSASDVERLGVRMSACMGFPASVPLMIRYEMQEHMEISKAWVLAAEACTLKADNCVQVVNCWGYFPDEPCDPVDDEFWCEGGSVRGICDYSADFVYREDCGDKYVDHAVCLELENDWSVCKAGACQVDDAYCQGNVAVNCDDGMLDRVDCSRAGLKCSVADEALWEKYAGCSIDGQLCKGWGNYCVGTKIVKCLEEDWHPEVVDCALLFPGLTCIDSGDGHAECTLPEDLRECENHVEKCNGNTLESCVLGKKFTFNCASFQGATCGTVDPDGEDEMTRCILDSWDVVPGW
jgi:hypothetical protein